MSEIYLNLVWRRTNLNTFLLSCNCARFSSAQPNSIRANYTNLLDSCQLTSCTPTSCTQHLRLLSWRKSLSSYFQKWGTLLIFYRGLLTNFCFLCHRKLAKNSDNNIICKWRYSSILYILAIPKNVKITATCTHSMDLILISNFKYWKF